MKTPIRNTDGGSEDSAYLRSINARRRLAEYRKNFAENIAPASPWLQKFDDYAQRGANAEAILKLAARIDRNMTDEFLKADANRQVVEGIAAKLSGNLADERDPMTLWKQRAMAVGDACRLIADLEDMLTPDDHRDRRMGRMEKLGSFRYLARHHRKNLAHALDMLWEVSPPHIQQQLQLSYSLLGCEPHAADHGHGR